MTWLLVLRAVDTKRVGDNVLVGVRVERYTLKGKMM